MPGLIDPTADPFQEGFKSALEGASIQDNPYLSSTPEADGWLFGWMDGIARIARSTNTVVGKLIENMTEEEVAGQDS